MYRKIADEVAGILLDQDGYLKPFSSAFYSRIPSDTLRLFCHFYGRYGLPTWELIEWLKSFIGDRSAIEIGAGCGDLGHLLGIPMTDNYCQEWPDVKLFYEAAQQPCIKYGTAVEEIDSLDAVRKYQPDIVIGQWVTHWIDPNLPPPKGGGSMYGIKEDLILKECKTYIMIGNRAIHGYKPILKLPHQEFDASFLRSRSGNPEKNVIYIWEN